MNEFELINRLTRNLPTNDSTLVGPGDDCAVLEVGLAGRWLLFKTDAVVEGIHFEAATDRRKVGHKALARCLSDIAAMAGTPTHALITLGLPEGAAVEQVEAMYEGLNALARRHQVAVVGGETTTSPERVFLSVALLGWVEAGRCPLRSGAQVGDAIFVTGDLGGSLVSGRHLDFEPRVEEARWLAGQFPIHAMIDLSDGLAGDLRHVLRASGVGAELLTDAIPISRAVPAARGTSGDIAVAGAGGLGRNARIEAALTDGEDFELLFAVPGGVAVRLLDAWKQRFGELRLSCIGRITEGPGVTLRGRRGTRPLTEHGYVHFQKS